MMAMDIAHGAAIHLGAGSRIIRLRPGVLVEQELTFTAPAEHLVYCTVYCGLPHDRMQGRIIVAADGGSS
jgi:heme/copper-type cytochrome/quinol oxidase subunit 2